MPKTTGTIRKAVHDCLNLIPSNKHLHYFHDRKGKILERVHFPQTILEEIDSALQKSGCLEPFFDFSPLKDDDAMHVLPQRIGGKPGLPFQGLHTLLPQYSLISRHLGGGLYLARFAVIDFHPMIEMHGVHNPLFVDTETDRILGFSPVFHRFFKRKFPDPAAILGRPAADFLDPSPAEFQAAMLPKFDPEKAGGFKTICETGSGAGSPDQVLSGAGWSVRPFDQDFILSVKSEIEYGEAPSLILGGTDSADGPVTDREGYLAGPQNGPRHSWWIIKKKSYVASARESAPSKAGLTLIHFCKIGRSLLIFEGRDLKAAFHDPDFGCPDPARLGLYLRPGNRCRLVRVTLKARPCGRPGTVTPEDRRYVLKLKNGECRFFAAEPFTNRVLSQTPYYRAAAYFLTDITALQGRISELDSKVRSLASRLTTPLHPFVGESPAIRSLKETARIAAGSPATVLIEGPTGAGKEVLARFIHGQSNRKEAPFVKVDCATIPESLIESRLFGHEKGAFTGATERQIGLFESAEGGTVFLDEIGNLALAVQAKLLQFLNDHTLTRLGGNRPVRLDIRLIAASNLSLNTLVGQGRFREDLFFRLNVIYLYSPSLSSRPEDILPLSRHFLDLYASEQGKPPALLSAGAEAKLRRHPWPGNVRELANVVQRAVIFSRGNRIESDAIEFPGTGRPESSVKGAGRTPCRVRLTPDSVLEEALRRHQGSAAAAAGELGMARATMFKLLKERGIRTERFRRGFGPAGRAADG